jgi:hypothetical protein
LFPVLAFLVFSCSKEELQNYNELAGNSSLKYVGSVVQVFSNGTDDTRSLTDAFALAKGDKGCSVEPFELLFPIPVQEIEVSNGMLKQPPGY